MIAQLVTEPFCLPHEAIARLTDRQIVDHYFHPRDEDGRLAHGDAARFDAPDGDEDPELVRARLRAMARAAGVEVKE